MIKEENTIQKVRENVEPITGWEPFRAFSHMRDAMDHMFNDLFRNITRTEPMPGLGTWLPAMDLYKSNGNLVAELAVPGFNNNEIEVHVEQDSLTVKGEYKRTQEKKTEGMYRSELSQGKIHRTVTLPYPVKTEHVKAKLENGLLKITMPLSNPDVHKTTKVKID